MKITTEGVVPSWPDNDKIYLDIASAHNKRIDAENVTAEVLPGSKSITLVMVCSAVGKAIPIKYRLDTKRAKGIADHPTYVKEYVDAVCLGIQMTAKGSRIIEPVKRFSEELGIPVNIVNEGLRKSLRI